MDDKYYYHEHMLRMFAPLLYKTLSRAGIDSRHLYYDDYLQELRLKLFHISRSFDGQPLFNDDDRYRFVAYAQRGLYWYLIDLLRMEPPCTASLDHFPQYQDDLTPLQTPIFLESFIAAARQRLSEDEFQLFQLLASDCGTYNEIASILNITRENLYKRRCKLKQKLHDIRNLLET